MASRLLKWIWPCERVEDLCHRLSEAARALDAITGDGQQRTIHSPRCQSCGRGEMYDRRLSDQGPPTGVKDRRFH